MKPFSLSILMASTVMFFPSGTFAADKTMGLVVTQSATEEYVSVLPDEDNDNAVSITEGQKSVPLSVITLDQAINRAIEKSPVLGASLARSDAATASRSQAGALPNPEISVEADNILGTGSYDGLDNAEVTIGVSQLIEMPGKRSNRARIADVEKIKVDYIRDATRLDLIRDVTIAYAEVATAQQEVIVFEEERGLATEVRDSVAAKVQAGKEPPIQVRKAEIELSSSEIALDRAQRNLIAKKQALSTLMGEDISDFTVSIDSLPEIQEPKAFEVYRSQLSQTPDVKKLGADVKQAESNLSLERANAVPDPRFTFGVKDFREDDSQAFVAGVSFPIPVFNMNRSGIERAGHDLNAAVFDKHSTQLSLDAQFSQAYGDFNSAFSEVSALESTVLPGAEEAFNFARKGYNAGKFDYLEVLDAQRTLFDTRKQFNESVLDYHRQRAIIERMTGLHLDNQNIQKEAENETVEN